MSTKVAVVTGSNKGIGFGIVERLARDLEGWKVYLTARNPELGLAAVKTLSDKGVTVQFHQLDVTSLPSIQQLASYLKDNYGGLDILVNNAGIAYKNSSNAPVSEQAEVTLRTNFFGALNVCKHLFPLLRPHARVVNVSGMLSVYALSRMSPELKKKFTSPMTMDELVNAMEAYVSDAQNGDPTEKGWAPTCNGTSKMGMTVMTIIQQREFDQDPREDLVVNAVCPGSVATDMSNHQGQLTTEEGADTPCYLATLPPNVTSPRGNLVTKRQIVPWQ